MFLLAGCIFCCIGFLTGRPHSIRQDKLRTCVLGLFRELPLVASVVVIWEGVDAMIYVLPLWGFVILLPCLAFVPYLHIAL